MIGICGGIGAGKSVVSRLLRCKGYEVYDCDFEAKRLMDTSEAMIAGMRARWGDAIYDERAGLDRREISRRVFADQDELDFLNSLVHGEVRRDLQVRNPQFVESAILFTSNLYLSCDEIWEVAASEATRISRVMMRSSLTEDQVRARIETQRGEREALYEACSRIGIPVRIIHNEGNQSVMEQTDQYLRNI